jgi:hypothetical protein
MPRLGPIRRADLIQYLRRLGFAGPFPGTKHQIMRRGEITVRNPTHTKVTSAPISSAAC